MPLPSLRDRGRAVGGRADEVAEDEVARAREEHAADNISRDHVACPARGAADGVTLAQDNHSRAAVAQGHGAVGRHADPVAHHGIVVGLQHDAVAMVARDEVAGCRLTVPPIVVPDPWTRIPGPALPRAASPLMFVPILLP